MLRRGILLTVLTCIALLPASAQEASDDQEPPYLYVVEEITFEIDGWTNPEDVLAFLQLEKGAKFISVEELAETLEFYERDLYNERVFNEVEVTFEILPGEELPRKVAVHFFIDDGWTVLPVAFYRYNSNSGHNPFVVLYWDNFLGTLTDFGFSAGYYSRNWVDPYGWDVRVDLNDIRMLDRKWNFGFDQEFLRIKYFSYFYTWEIQVYRFPIGKVYRYIIIYLDINRQSGDKLTPTPSD